MNDSPADMIAQAEQVTNVIIFMINIRNLTSRITETITGGALQAEHATDGMRRLASQSITLPKDEKVLRLTLGTVDHLISNIQRLFCYHHRVFRMHEDSDDNAIVVSFLRTRKLADGFGRYSVQKVVGI